MVVLRIYQEDDIERFLNICRQYNIVYCYGAGHHGHGVWQLLNKHNIAAKSFIISKDDGTDLTLPVMCWDAIRPEDLKGSLIVLSLGERLHKEIIDKIGEKCSDVSIFPVSDALFESFPAAVHNWALAGRIQSAGRFALRDIEAYQQRAEALFGKYDEILLRYLIVERIGSMSLGWLYYNSIEHSDRTFWLFYPGRAKVVVNTFLYGKIVNSDQGGMGVVNDSNVGFWKYMLDTFPQRVKVDASGADPAFLMRLNRKIMSIDKKEGRHFISFTPEEERQGNALLEKYGLKDYVCVFARDGQYTQKCIGMQDKQELITDDYRELPINNFSLTAHFLRGNDIKTVRMGSMPEGDAPENIFDYGRKCHSDFMDVFLMAKCRYLICTPSGVQHLADLFSKNIVIVNSPVLSTDKNYTYVGRDGNLMIFQKYWDTRNKRYLTIRQMLRYEIYGKDDSAVNGPRRTFCLYYRDRIEPVKNTPEEILAVTQEMEEILAGTVQYDEADLELRRKYESILEEFADAPNFIFQYQIGRNFLRENQWLLE